MNLSFTDFSEEKTPAESSLIRRKDIPYHLMHPFDLTSPSVYQESLYTQSSERKTNLCFKCDITVILSLA